MKPIYQAIAVSLLLLPFTMTAQAEEKKPEPPKHDMHQGMQGNQGMQGHQGMPMQGMMGGMHEEMMSPEHLKKKQAHMLLMHDLSNKILAEKDPKKQQALKDQQLAVMKAHMKEMMAKRHQMKMSHPAPPPPPPAPESEGNK